MAEKDEERTPRRKSWILVPMREQLLLVGAMYFLPLAVAMLLAMILSR